MLREMENYLTCLSQTCIFSSLPVSTLRKYYSYFFPKTLKLNQSLPNPVYPDDMYIITSGELQLWTQKGQTKINLVTLSRGECFGFPNLHPNTFAKSLGET